MKLVEKIDEYLNESEKTYEIIFDPKYAEQIEKLAEKKFKGTLSDINFEDNEAVAQAYIPKKYTKQFEKELDKLNVVWD